MQRSSTLFALTLMGFAAAHGVFAWHNRDRRADLDILTAPPGRLVRTAMAFGDEQFLYRAWALDLQNAGDTGGQSTPMRSYNYDFVISWLETLQALDPRAQQHDFLATDYFSLTPKLGDVRRVLAFVEADVALNPAEKWIWLARAIEIATLRLKDTAYALALSQRLSAYELPEIPYAAAILPAIFLEKLGRTAEARTAIHEVLEKRAGKLTPEDQSWAETFIQRLPND